MLVADSACVPAKSWGAAGAQELIISRLIMKSNRGANGAIFRIEQPLFGMGQ
jgi:hypothetical protein